MRYGFELAEDVTIPSGSVLRFEGGSISGAQIINFNGGYVDAPKGNVIFGENINVQGLNYAHASWLGIMPSATDSGSSRLVHFCSSPNCDGFELEFDKAEYRFAIHGLLLNKYMKIKGAPDRSTKWFVAIDASCDYVIGVNRHCSVSNLDIRLANVANQTGVDFFRVSNSWSDDEDAADTMKLNYDYSFDTIWLKGSYVQDGDYSSCMNGIAIRFRDKEVGSEVDNKVLYAAGPQHCDNIMIEMVRAGIVFEVTNGSGVGDYVWANGFSFTNLFVQGNFGYEQILSANTGSSGTNYICNFQYQGKPTPDGYALYGQLDGTRVCNLKAHDTYKLGSGTGTIWLCNCDFSDSGENPYTDLVDGFKAFNGAYPRVFIMPYKQNHIYLVPTAARPRDGVMLHNLDFSENYKRKWTTRNDQSQYIEEFLDANEYYSKCSIQPYSKKEHFKNLIFSTSFTNSGLGTTRVVDMKSFPSGYGAYQDNAFMSGYTRYGFKIKSERLNSGSFNEGDVLQFTYTFGLVSGSEYTLADKLLYINNLCCTAGDIHIDSITKSASSIVVNGKIEVKHGGSLANDGVIIEYKILEVSTSILDETQSLWYKGQITEAFECSLLRKSYGSWANRPTNGLYTGLTYFNTDTNKQICYNNSKWYNPDGSEATA